MAQYGQRKKLAWGAVSLWITANGMYVAPVALAIGDFVAVNKRTAQTDGTGSAVSLPRPSLPSHWTWKTLLHGALVLLHILLSVTGKQGPECSFPGISQVCAYSK